jgi:hypothetical protein
VLSSVLNLIVKVLKLKFITSTVTQVDDNGAATVQTTTANTTNTGSNNYAVVRTASVVGEPVQQLQHGVLQTSAVVATTAAAAVPMNLADLEKRLRREAEIRLREETARLRAEMESRYKLELDARHRREEEDKQRQKGTGIIVNTITDSEHCAAAYNAVSGAIDVLAFRVLYATVYLGYVRQLEHQVLDGHSIDSSLTTAVL